MIKYYLNWLAISLGGLIIGLGIGYGFFYVPIFAGNETLEAVIEENVGKKEVIGFLPYWLLSKAQTDYSDSITTLTYFGLTVDIDGTILKETAPSESEPGWFTLKSGKVDPYLNTARDKGVKLSLLIFAGNPESIRQLVSDPVVHATKLIAEIKPIMEKYQFTDLNLDIESTHEVSDQERINFSQFVKTVKQELNKSSLGTLSVEIAPDMLVKKGLVDLSLIKNDVDQVVLMAYDYHFIGSQVSGPVAPLKGVGVESEFDVTVSTDLALEKIEAKKLILGVPLYGYQWETLREGTRSATIPSSGLSVSTKYIVDHLSNCQNCLRGNDVLASEKYFIDPDAETGTFYQAFYPDVQSMQSKIDLARHYRLGGMALWALGYEDKSILKPLEKY